MVGSDLPTGCVDFRRAEHLTFTPNNDVFVKPSLATGVLPEILQELLMARKRWDLLIGLSAFLHEWLPLQLHLLPSSAPH